MIILYVAVLYGLYDVALQRISRSILDFHGEGIFLYRQFAETYRHWQDWGNMHTQVVHKLLMPFKKES